jgi:ATP-dependent Clp protease ATP-binding subunit ClpA
MNGYNFTERVRKTLAMAREEAAKLRHEYVGTEHILLGLIAEGEGVAATVLQNLGVDLDDLRFKIETTVKRGSTGARTGPDLPYTSRAKKVLELSMSAARALDHPYVGTEHLLLGLLREQRGIAAQVLNDAGVTEEGTAAETLRILGTPSPELAEKPAGTPNLRPWPERMRLVLGEAHAVAGAYGSVEIGSAHVAIALLRHGEGVANAALDLLGFDRARALDALDKIATRGAAVITPETEMRRDAVLISALLQAEDDARSISGRPRTDHLLVALMETAPEVAGVFAEQNVTAAAFKRQCMRISG